MINRDDMRLQREPAPDRYDITGWIVSIGVVVLVVLLAWAVVGSV